MKRTQRTSSSLEEEGELKTYKIKTRKRVKFECLTCGTLTSSADYCDSCHFDSMLS